MKYILSITPVIVLCVEGNAHKVNYETLAKSINQMKKIVNLQKTEPEKAKIRWIQFMFEIKKGKEAKGKQITENKKNIKQVEAELCQAQEKLGLVNCGCLPFTLKLRSSSIYLKIEVVFHLP